MEPMGGARLGLLLAASLAAGDGGGHTCVVDGPASPSGSGAEPAQLVLPVPGEDVCEALRAHCGGGREGALCVKAALETVLPDDRHVSAIRSSMRVPSEFYFLCAGPGAHGGASGSARVAALTGLLRRAASTGELGTRPGAQLDAEQAGADYRAAARWSALSAAGWTVAEKVEHFLLALEILPDNAHCIDRLAVALGEAGRAPLDGGPGPPGGRMRDMLLHYAVLRRIIAHPLQRPLALTPGLTARPFWATDASSAPWLASLVRPQQSPVPQPICSQLTVCVRAFRSSSQPVSQRCGASCLAPVAPPSLWRRKARAYTPAASGRKFTSWPLGAGTHRRCWHFQKLHHVRCILALHAHRLARALCLLVGCSQCSPLIIWPVCVPRSAQRQWHRDTQRQAECAAGTHAHHTALWHVQRKAARAYWTARAAAEPSG